ncbi:MAG TPA: TfoX/Sxy family protein [Vicinamibacterales bacterium]|nr:TfoX/Sxy family protein [Vicinamibacterales bacterium]
MAVSDAYLAFVLEQLGGVKAVAHRRMFGGIGLYAGERFFGVIDNNTLFFKVDAASVGDYTRAKMKPFQPDPKGRPMTGYYQVPPSVLEEAEKLASWAKRAAEIQSAKKGTRQEH